MLNRLLIAKLDFKKPHVWLATWFGSGLMAKAPGTWGTLAGLPFVVSVGLYGGLSGLILFAVLVSAIGYWAADRFEKETGLHDAGAVVIDEVAGLTIAFFPILVTPLNALMAFALFRFFDILKPWPVSWCDRRPGATGVMADDLAAGLYTALILGGLRYAGFG